MEYRTAARPGKRRRIVYGLGRLDLAFVIYGVVMVAVAVVAPLLTVVIRLQCARDPTDGLATCTLTRYAVEGVDHERFRTSDLRKVEIEGLPGASDIAGVRLEIRDSRDGPRGVHLVSGTGREKFVSRAEAEEAKRALEAFAADGATRELTLWLRPGILWFVLGSLWLVLGGLFGVAQIRAAFARRARIPIDAGPDGLAFLGQEFSASEVMDVEVETGEMPSARTTSGTTTGHRLVVVTRDGRRVPLGEAFRAGPREGHEAVRSRILAAIGRV